MSEETIDSQIIRFIKAQGRSGGLYLQISEVARKIDSFDSQVAKSNKEKEAMLAEIEKADREKAEADKGVVDAENALSSAEARLEAAEKQAERVKVYRDSFTGERLAKFDDEIIKLSEDKQSTIVEKDELVAELTLVSEQIKELKAELRKQGYDVSFTQPRTTVL